MESMQQVYDRKISELNAKIRGLEKRLEDLKAAALRVVEECDRREREGSAPAVPWLDLNVLRRFIGEP